MLQRKQRGDRSLPVLIWLILSLCVPAAIRADETLLNRIPERNPRNVVLILVDDHRFDALSCLGHPFLETPHLDALAGGGVLFENALVTTSLCSPSRASILTGLYMHNHHVVGNGVRVPAKVKTVAEYLKASGYATAFIGKWHMGGSSDAPRPGWTRWVSFPGQGSYKPDGATLNVDGRRVARHAYMTDELTDYAVDWLKSRDGTKPFFLYLSHKGVHATGENRRTMFVPAPRHEGRYAKAKWTLPSTYADTAENYRLKPMWVKNQRNSWHGVDHAFYLDKPDMATIYRAYCETLLSIDDSVGRVMACLKEQGLDRSTLVLYLGDNGFCFGEHGLIDKRHAYEPSMRIPMLAHCPELFKAATRVDELVANVDMAPTVLEAAGLKPPRSLDGRSLLDLASGKKVPWRKHLLYEYYWTRGFPQTPTTMSLRTKRYKYIAYLGVWDIDELYDLDNDPEETRNLIDSSEHKQIVKDLRAALRKELKNSGGGMMPVGNIGPEGSTRRLRTGASAAEFPERMYRE